MQNRKMTLSWPACCTGIPHWEVFSYASCPIILWKSDLSNKIYKAFDVKSSTSLGFFFYTVSTVMIGCALAVFRKLLTESKLDD